MLVKNNNLCILDAFLASDISPNTRNFIYGHGFNMYGFNMYVPNLALIELMISLNTVKELGCSIITTWDFLFLRKSRIYVNNTLVTGYP